MQLLYRFLVLYFGVYFFPFPLSVVSGLTVMPAPLRWIGEAAASVEGFVQMGFNALAMWVGEEVLRLGRGAVVIQPTGSGDTLAAYIQALCIFTVAVIGACCGRCGRVDARCRRGSRTHSASTSDTRWPRFS